MVRPPTIAMTAALVLAQAYVPAQTADGVTFHDLDQMTGRGFGQFSELRAVVTDSSSFAHFVVPARYRQTPHHHDQEQFTLGLAGALDYTIGAVTLRLGGHGVGLPPSNVLHAMTNDGDTPATVVEFQPVRRLDWLPAAAPQPPQPRSAEPDRSFVTAYRPGLRTVLDRLEHGRKGHPGEGVVGCVYSRIVLGPVGQRRRCESHHAAVFR